MTTESPVLPSPPWTILILWLLILGHLYQGSVLIRLLGQSNSLQQQILQLQTQIRKISPSTPGPSPITSSPGQQDAERPTSPVNVWRDLPLDPASSWPPPELLRSISETP